VQETHVTLENERLQFLIGFEASAMRLGSGRMRMSLSSMMRSTAASSVEDFLPKAWSPCCPERVQMVPIVEALHRMRHGGIVIKVLEGTNSVPMRLFGGRRVGRQGMFAEQLQTHGSSVGRAGVASLARGC
jgi:hypothetical protein